MTDIHDDSFVDWSSFASIYNYSLLYWPKTVQLSGSQKQGDEADSFTAFQFDDEVDYPYFDSGRSKHIVRHMLWAMFCGLPRDREGTFSPAEIIDQTATRLKFEDSVRSDIEESNDYDPEELVYYNANMVVGR